jgi:hypothetical protein
MKVKMFDFEHEIDLENAINEFLTKNNIKIINIYYQACHFYAGNEQVFSFSALILYQNNE